MSWFEWWNELCYNVGIWRMGRKFTKERKKFSCFSLNFFFLANERIIGRISFIDCVNMGSRIMILVKVWYKLINLIKIFEWERVYIYIYMNDKKWCDILVNLERAVRPTPQQEL